jgi:hypothetical protein
VRYLRRFDGWIAGPGSSTAFCRRWYEAATREITRWRLLLEAERRHALTGRWPLASDWDRHANRGELRDLLERYHHRSGPWPHPATVGRIFGSRSDFHATLGHTPRPGDRGHGKGSADRRAARAFSLDHS